MSQEQENTGTDNHKTASGRDRGYQKERIVVGVIRIAVPVLVLVTAVLCVVMLVQMTILNGKVEALEQGMQALQETDKALQASQAEQAGYQMAPYESLSDISDIDGNAVDESEAADIAEAAAHENKLVWSGDGARNSGIRRVYLTFDDGPSSNTDRILDILDEYGVKATFFVVGKEGYADQYRRIVEDGHTLGMHSYSHKYSEIYVSQEAYAQDLTKLHDFLYELTGVDCDIVRFPGGSSNSVSQVDMHELIAYLDEEGMTYFDWNVSSGDATGHYKNANQIAANVLDNIDKYNNAVVLFHDAAGKDSTVEALPLIIEKILESEDTVILPISEDTVKVQHIQ